MSPVRAILENADDQSHIIIEKTFEMSKSDTNNDSESIAGSDKIV